MSKEFLHRANIGAALEQMRRERVAQGMDRNRFGNASLSYGLLELPIQPLFKQVMAAHHAGLWGGRQLGVPGKPKTRPSFPPPEGICDPAHAA